MWAGITKLRSKPKARVKRQRYVRAVLPKRVAQARANTKIPRVSFMDVLLVEIFGGRKASDLYHRPARDG
jgi:hypothetical protein